jgi:hypothetical protein
MLKNKEIPDEEKIFGVRQEILRLMDHCGVDSILFYYGILDAWMMAASCLNFGDGRVKWDLFAEGLPKLKKYLEDADDRSDTDAP